MFPKALSTSRAWSPKHGAGFHTYHIPAAPLGGHVEVEVSGAFQPTYYGEDIGQKYEYLTALKVATDLVNEFTINVIGASAGFSGPGLAVRDPSIPLEEQIAKLKESQEAYFTYLFQAAEDLDKTPGLSGSITQEMRDAARWLGREGVRWFKPYKQQLMKKCRFCVSDIPEEAIVCQVCGRDLVEGATGAANAPHRGRSV